MKKTKVLYSLLALVAVLGVGSWAVGQGVPGVSVFDGGVYNFFEASDPEEPTFGTGVGEYVTINELEYGDALSVPLGFVAGATTTPGGLARILNIGTNKVCDNAQINITDGSGTGGDGATGNSLAFSVGTSTSRTAHSGDAVGTNGIIASSTHATGTAVLFDSVDQGGNAASSWRWPIGTYLLVSFDDQNLSKGDADYSTSSAAYTGMAGTFYADCHVE